jgi:O-antigen ligase
MLANSLKRTNAGFAALIAAGTALSVGTGALVASGMIQIGPDPASESFLGFAIALVPLLVLAAIRWPAAVPFCFFALIAPLDGLTIAGVDSAGKLIGALTGAVILASIVMRRQYVRAPAAVAVWGLVVGWTVLSLMWTQAPALGIERTTQVVSLFGLAVVLAFARVTRVELGVALTAVILGGVIASAYGIQLYLHGDFSQKYAGVGRVDLGRIDPNYFASALLLPALLAAVAVLRSSNLLVKCVLLPFALMPAIGILISGSRGAILALAVGFAFLMLRTRYRAQLGVLVIVIAVASVAFPVVWDRFADPTQGDASGRFDIWTVGLAAFRDHWLAGAGVGSWNAAYEDAYLKVHISRLSEGWSKDSHNLLMEVAVETGVIGVALLLAALWTQFGTLKLIPHKSALFDWRCAIEASTIALVFNALSLPHMLMMKWVWLVFYLAFILRGAWLTDSANMRPISKTFVPGTA